MFPFAVEYPPETAVGYWGKGTSTIDWCEENYVVSPYIAEALNTVTNSWFVVLSLYSIYGAVRNRHDTRFIFVAAGFGIVGVGSWLFHMTLLYEYQLMDELPMIYSTCIPFWCVFSEFKSTKQSVGIGLGIFFAANVLSSIYLYFKNPTIHQTGYGIMNAIVIYRSIALAKTHVKDPVARKNLNTTMMLGISHYLFGYLLWNLDIHLCSILRSTRRAWGMPYGFVLEGHGWWHIFTGTGVYYYLVYLEYLRVVMTNRAEYYDLVWSYNVFPEVVLNAKGKKHFFLKSKAD